MTAEADQDSPSFNVLDLSDPADRQCWLAVWESWPLREVFAHPNYVRLYSEGIGEGKCAVFASGMGKVLYPFIHRTIPSTGTSGQVHTDITSPYGYGGCFAWDVTDEDSLRESFYAHLDRWALSEHVVSEFVRLSLFTDQRLEFPEIERERSLNVVRNLDVDEDVLWRDYDAKVRKNVQKARRSQVSVEVDETGQSVEAFHRIFSSTMDRRNAATAYLRPIEFFDDLNRSLMGQFAYINAMYQGAVVSTELVLVSERSVYSFLGGTLSDRFDLRPNDLLKHEIALWARDRGKDHFVLGGGYQPNDGIFRYKKAFSPRGLVPFRTGERILDNQVYQELVKERVNERLSSGNVEHINDSFFPPYRAI